MIWICAANNLGGQFLELVINQQNLKDVNPAELYKGIHWQDGFFGKWLEIQRGNKLKGDIKLVGENGFVKKEFDIRRECLLDNNLIAGFTHIEGPAIDDYAKENGDIVLQVVPGPYIVHFVKRESVYTGNDPFDLGKALYFRHLDYSRSFNLYHKNNRIIFPQQCFMENPRALSSLIPNFDEDLFRSNRDYYKEQNYTDIKNQDIINEVLNIFNNLIMARGRIPSDEEIETEMDRMQTDRNRNGHESTQNC